MIGIVIVSHGGLAAELLKAAEHVVGPIPAARAIGLGPKDDLAERRAEIQAAVRALDSGAGVVILTDLFGGTPSNLAIAAMASERADVVSGVNLPLLMKLATSRGRPRREAVQLAVESGRKYILDVAEVLTTEPRPRNGAGESEADGRGSA